MTTTETEETLYVITPAGEAHLRREKMLADMDALYAVFQAHQAKTTAAMAEWKQAGEVEKAAYARALAAMKVSDEAFAAYDAAPRPWGPSA